MAYITTVTEVEYKSELESTKDIPYLTVKGKLWGVFCEDCWENRHYISIALYVKNCNKDMLSLVHVPV